MPFVLFILLGLLAPRAALIICLLTGVFGDVAWPCGCWAQLIGILCLPYTALAYGAAFTYGGGLTGWWAILLCVAFLADAGVLGGGASSARRGK